MSGDDSDSEYWDGVTVAAFPQYNTTNSNEENGTNNSGYVVVKKTTEDWMRHIFLTDLFFLISLLITIAYAGEFWRLRKDRPSERNVGRFKVRMILAALFLGVSVTLHFLDGIFEEILVDYYAHQLCGVSKWLKAITGSSAFLFSYLVMWLRQRSIYNEPTMAHLTTRAFRVLSSIVLMLLVASPVANTIIYVSCFSFGVVVTGCAIIGSTINPQTPWVVIAVTSIVMQTILLGLFVMPLYKHQSNMAGMNGNAFNLKPIIVRALIAASACALTDTGTAFLAATHVYNDGVTIGVSMQLSTFLNLLLVVLSFPDWKQTMLPCYRRKNRKEREAREQAYVASDGTGTTAI